MPADVPEVQESERVYEVRGLYGPWYVGYREPGVFHVVAECGVKANAEEIAAALNAARDYQGLAMLNITDAPKGSDG